MYIVAMLVVRQVREAMLGALACVTVALALCARKRATEGAIIAHGDTFLGKVHGGGGGGGGFATLQTNVCFGLLAVSAMMTGKVQMKGRGTFKKAHGDQDLYIGEVAHGFAHGVGVLEWADGGSSAGGWLKGQRDGPTVFRFKDGRTHYYDYDRGDIVHFTIEWKDGSCRFDNTPCDPTDVPFAALKAQSLTVEARAKRVAAEIAGMA